MIEAEVGRETVMATTRKHLTDPLPPATDLHPTSHIDQDQVSHPVQVQETVHIQAQDTVHMIKGAHLDADTGVTADTEDLQTTGTPLRTARTQEGTMIREDHVQAPVIMILTTRPYVSIVTNPDTNGGIADNLPDV